jgi:hypothetical protein
VTADTRSLLVNPEMPWRRSYGFRLDDKACRQPFGSGLGRCGRTFGLHRHACARVRAHNVTNPLSCQICQIARRPRATLRRSVVSTLWRKLRHGVAQTDENNAPGNLPTALPRARLGTALGSDPKCLTEASLSHQLPSLSGRGRIIGGSFPDVFGIRGTRERCPRLAIKCSRGTQHSEDPVLHSMKRSALGRTDSLMNPAHVFTRRGLPNMQLRP